MFWHIEYHAVFLVLILHMFTMLKLIYYKFVIYCATILYSCTDRGGRNHTDKRSGEHLDGPNVSLCTIPAHTLLRAQTLSSLRLHLPELVAVVKLKYFPACVRSMQNGNYDRSD